RGQLRQPVHRPDRRRGPGRHGRDPRSPRHLRQLRPADRDPRGLDPTPPPCGGSGHDRRGRRDAAAGRLEEAAAAPAHRPRARPVPERLEQARRPRQGRSVSWESPLGSRYASPAMQSLWGERRRIGLWRRLWLALMEAQRDLGLDIPAEAITQLRAHLDDVDLAKAADHEKRLRHDVMAHIHALGDQAPAARAFLHLGATSAYVTDNTDLIVLRDAMKIVLGRVVAVLTALRSFALRHRNLPTVAYTHFQPAQLTTVGKRATLWLHDFALDATALRDRIADLPLRGCKGTTGTQASFLELFHGDHEKVRELDRRVATSFGFAASIPVSGQTYTRKIDARVLDLFAAVAESAAKFGTDLRLLQHEGEVLEPVE